MSATDDSQKKESSQEGEMKPLLPLITPPQGAAAPDPRRARAMELAATQNDTVSDGEGNFALTDGNAVVANAQTARAQKAAAPPPVADNVRQNHTAPRGPIEQLAKKPDLAKTPEFDIRTNPGTHNFIVCYNVSPQFAEQVAHAANQTPANHLLALSRAGYHIVVAKDLATYDQLFHTKLSGVHPPGYPAGWTWNNVDVIFDDKNNRVLAFENFLDPRNYNAPASLKDNVYMPGRLMHELGHAHDDLFNKKIQNDPKALEIYTHCVRNLQLDPVDKSKMGYFTQTGPDHPGLREAIAESYSIIHSTGAEGLEDNIRFKKYFGQFIDYLRKAKY